MLRKQLRMTQNQLAERLGVTFVSVRRWETSQVKPNRLALRALSSRDETTPETEFYYSELQEMVDGLCNLANASTGLNLRRANRQA